LISDSEYPVEVASAFAVVSTAEVAASSPDAGPDGGGDTDARWLATWLANWAVDQPAAGEGAVATDVFEVA
jgi:hypothetical protein